MSNVSNKFRFGEHVCVLYDTPAEQRAIAAEYVGDGLRLGLRCYYVADSAASFSQFHEALRAAGIDPGDALRRGALIEATHTDAHLSGGRFDSERMLALLNQAIESALNDGFAGLRTCGDMSWLLHEPPGHEQVVEYEGLLNGLFHGARACGMCQYDRARLPEQLLSHALATHTFLYEESGIKANPHFQRT